MTHSKAEFGDVHVELVRVKVDEAEECSEYPYPLLAASAEHVLLCQDAVETAAQFTQTIH